MAEPIPDFTRDERHAVTRTLLERGTHAYPARERAIERKPEGLYAVADGGKRVVST
jgi:hypothetical protein